MQDSNIKLRIITGGVFQSEELILLAILGSMGLTGLCMMVVDVFLLIWAPSQYKDRLICVWRFPC